MRRSRGRVRELLTLTLAGVLLLAPGCTPRAAPKPAAEAESEPLRLQRLQRAESTDIVSELQRMRLDDPCAQAPLWSLGDKPGCVAGQRVEGLRFLGAPTDDVFSAAASALQHCLDPEVEGALRQQVHTGNAFRRYRAWDVLYWGGHEEVLSEMVAALSDPSASTEARTDLLRRTLSVDARALAPTYIELLTDRDARVRYVVIKELGLLAGTELGYRHRESITKNRAALARWRRWYRERAATLPRKWQRSGEIGIVGVRLVSSLGDLQIAEVFRGSGAERAGIRAGDVLHTVNQNAVAGEDAWAVAMYELQGPPGTGVVLEVERPGQFRRREFRVRRSRWVGKPPALRCARPGAAHSSPR